MFWKKPAPSEKQPGQSQSLSGSNVVGSQIQMTQAGRDATVAQSGQLAAQQQGLTGADVVKLLEELEAAVKAASLPAAQQEEALDYLKPAKREAGKEDKADKDFVAQNLKKTGEALEGVDKATTAGKQLWEKSVAVFETIAPWLGSASKLLGF